jgi:prolycopene isomerase
MDNQNHDTGAARSEYDVIVVGGGLGGLTSGALLARAGKSVLVVDEQPRPGGHAHAVVEDGCTFDSAVHLITRVGMVQAVLAHLGVGDRCRFLRVDNPFYTVRFPEFTLQVPSGREAYLEAHLQHFPDEARGLRRLTELSSQIARELGRFPEEPGISDLLLSPRRFPALFHYRNATMREVIDRELHDPRLKSAYATLWAWVGSPPSRASFLVWAAMMGHYIDDGAYYCRGGFQALADAVADALRLAGGEITLGRRVLRIDTARRRVHGVTLDNGQRIAAPVVISNADPLATFERLLGEAQAPAHLLRNLRHLEPSISVDAAYMTTDLDVRSFGLAHENLLFSLWDHEQGYAEGLVGGVPGMSVTIPTLTDPSVAPPGRHIIIAMTIAHASAPAAARATEAAERVCSLAERLIPGLRSHLTSVAGVTATDSGALKLQHIGRIYGPALTPKQVGTRRLGHRTPFHGLYLVGQATQPGHGIPWVIESGFQVARHVLGPGSAAEIVTDEMAAAYSP